MSVFLPVFWGLTDVIAFILQPLAIAMVVVNSATLMVAVRLPVERDDDSAGEIVGSGLLCLVAASVFIALVGLGVGTGFGNSELVRIGLGAAMMTVAQGLYVVYVAHRTRSGDYAAIMRARLVYGVAIFTLTLLACILHLDGLLFIVGNAFAFVVAVVLGLNRRGGGRASRAALRRALTLRGLVRQIVASRTLSLSYILGGFASQAGALSIGFVGALQDAWALMLRISGGFSTIGLQLLGPAVDIRLARAIRDRAGRSHLAAVMWRGAVFGILLAASVLGTSVLAIAWTGAYYGNSTDEVVGMIVGGVGYVAVSAILSPISRSLGMIGPHRLRLVWDASRAALSLACIVLFSGPLLIIALGVVGITTCTLYLLLCWRAIGRPESGQSDAPEIAPSRGF